MSYLPASISERTDKGAPNGCWLWLGYINKWGYGIFTYQGRTHQAYRLVYTLLRGEPATGLQLDHLCRNRACVNPDHLEPVVQRMNILRGEGLAAENARKTSCKWGHEFTAANTRVRTARNGQQHRSCRACNVEAVRRYRQRRAA